MRQVSKKSTLVNSESPRAPPTRAAVVAATRNPVPRGLGRRPSGQRHLAAQRPRGRRGVLRASDAPFALQMSADGVGHRD
jgi:hypothetical protein